MPTNFKIRHQESGLLLVPKRGEVYTGSPLQVLGVKDEKLGVNADDTLWVTNEDVRAIGRGHNIFHKKTGALLTGNSEGTLDNFFYLRTTQGYDLIEQRFIFADDPNVPDFSKLVTISFPSRLAYMSMTESKNPAPVLVGPRQDNMKYYNWCLEFV